MRKRSGWLALLLAAGFTLLPSTSWGQVSTNGDYAPPDTVVPLPLYSSRPEKGGFYLSSAFLFFRQTNTVKHQLIAIRGFNDFDGSIQAAINSSTAGHANDPIIPGKFFGSGVPALDANQVSGPLNYQPGWAFTLGWRFGEGSFMEAVEFRMRHLVESKYTAVASLVPNTFLANTNLEDTFLFSPVFNFPNDFAGSISKIAIASAFNSASSASATAQFNSFPVLNIFGNPVPAQSAGTGNNTATNFAFFSGVVAASASGSIIVPQAPFGIWNGATTMTLSFVQRYDDYEIMGRFPIYQGETCRCYGLAGPRLVALWERFTWRTIDTNTTSPNGQTSANVTFPTVTVTGGNATNLPTVSQSGGSATTTVASLNSNGSGENGSTDPADTAIYSNVVSNRLYGPMVGIGNEWYIGHGFATSLDLRAAALIDFVKGIEKYERGDHAIAAKRARDVYTIVPELDAIFNLSWYPVEGVEFRVGYELMTYFNTAASPRPVSFNFGGLDAPLEKGVFRMFDGFHAELSFVF